jgi:[ribosomal protein S18]-alanine N-acetyltransferase
VSVVVRLASSTDADDVARLEQQAFGADAWSVALIGEGVSGRIPTTLYLLAGDTVSNAPSSVAEPGGTVCGYAAASIVADVAELQRIAVHAHRRRSGVASALLARVEHEALIRHADHVLLEVRENNAAACAFYAARGFSEIDRRARYYADGTTAVVLRKELIP